MPTKEKEKFNNTVIGQALKYGMTADEYLRKVWYHEEAARLGEYVAMSLLQERLELVSFKESNLDS